MIEVQRFGRYAWTRYFCYRVGLRGCYTVVLLLVLTHGAGRGERGGEACSPEGPRYTFYNIALYWQLVRYLCSAVQRDRLLYLTEKLRQKLPVITTACFVLHDRINALTDRDIYQFSFYFHLALIHTCFSLGHRREAGQTRI